MAKASTRTSGGGEALPPGQPQQGRIFRVGITGHRPNKLSPAAIPRIEAKLGDLFDTLDSLAPALLGRDIGLALVSSFAEGTDQMAVAACPGEWAVEAILPFPKDEYLKDFEQSAAGDGRDVRGEFLARLARASSVSELPLPQGPRHDGYLAAGLAMLDRSDMLVAVWDGMKPKPGGTGVVVEEACRRGMPVLWLASDASRGPVLIERFAGGRPTPSTVPWAAALSGRVQVRNPR